MSPGLLDILMPYIDCANCAAKEKKNKSIFIFLSNAGGSMILKELMKKLEEGVSRESTTIQDFEESIILDTLNRSGGLFESLLVKSDAITYYVPFLPLDKSHVQKCIIEIFESSKVEPTEELIDEVFQELRFGPEPKNLFSNSGCKRVASTASRISITLKYNDNENHHNGEL